MIAVIRGVTSPRARRRLLRQGPDRNTPMGCGASTPEPPRYVTPARAVQAGRAMPQPGAYSNYYAQAEAAFRAGDVNGDGVLDAQELYMVLVRLGFFNGVPPQNVQAMMEEQMARADSSVRDRKVTFDEFVPYFEYLMHQLAQRGIVQQPAAPTQFYGQPQYGAPSPQYGAPAPQYGAPAGGAASAKYGAPPGAQFGAPQHRGAGAGGARGGGGNGGKAGGVGAGGIAAAVVGGAVVGSVLTDGGGGIASAAGSAGGAIASGAGAAGGAIASGAGAVADWAPGAMSSAGGAISSGAGAVADWAPGAVDSVGGFASNAGGAVADWAPGAMSSVGGFASDAGGAIGGIAGDAAGEVGSFAVDAISAISDFFG